MQHSVRQDSATIGNKAMDTEQGLRQRWYKDSRIRERCDNGEMYTNTTNYHCLSTIALALSNFKLFIHYTDWNRELGGVGRSGAAYCTRYECETKMVEVGGG